MNPSIQLSTLGLKRYPILKSERLLGWDSADQLVLDHVCELDLNGKRILIMGDCFGAISRGLDDIATQKNQRFDISVYTDSYISFKSTKLNTLDRITAFNRLSEMSEMYDIVLIRVPKNMSFFEDMLAHLSNHLSPDSKIICGYMVKHQANASFDLLGKYIGKTSTSLAKKKARLIFAEVKCLPRKNVIESIGTSTFKPKVTSPFPVQIDIQIFENQPEVKFTHHSNLFSREKIDIGTRFFLEHIPVGSFQHILDLGCANGIVGIAAKIKNPTAKIIFSDESFMAIESAITNYKNTVIRGDETDLDDARFLWTHSYENQAAESLDLVLCNPPFHQGLTVGNFTAVQMFKDAFRSLRSGGLLRVIGNSHLQYHKVLKTIFGNCKVIATNRKFMITDAVKTI